MTCETTGKRCYENRSAVIAASRNVNQPSPGMKGKKKRPDVPYHSHACGRWHLGSRLPELAPDGNSSSKRKRRKGRT